MTPRAVRPALARKCAAGLSEARLASRVTLALDTECIPVSTSAARAETSGCRRVRGALAPPADRSAAGRMYQRPRSVLRQVCALTGRSEERRVGKECRLWS